jgi:hypothetical protein
MKFRKIPRSLKPIWEGRRENKPQMSQTQSRRYLVIDIRYWVLRIWYQLLAWGNLYRFLYFTIRRYLKFMLISDKHQYPIPNTQYHL